MGEGFIFRPYISHEPRWLIRYSNYATGLTTEESWFDSRKSEEICLIIQSGHTGSGAHPKAYPMGIGGCFPGGEVKRPWGYADHSPPSSVKIKNEGNFNSISPYMASWCVQGRFYLLYLGRKGARSQVYRRSV